MKTRVVFRADGDSQMGLGHVVRSTAIAENIGDGFECILYTRSRVETVLAEAAKVFERVYLLDNHKALLTEAKELLEKVTAEDIVVLDGYHFTELYQQGFHEKKIPLVCIDDIYRNFFYADVVINSAAGITTDQYKALPGVQFYLGPAYTMLRKTFLNKAVGRDSRTTNNNVFVCLGGADPENKTLQVVKFLAGINRFDEMRIVTGGGYQHWESLQQYIQQAQVPIKHKSALKGEEMASEMAECSYAVCSPSTVCFEYMTIGGVLYLEQIADNQTDMLNSLTKEGFAFPLEKVGKPDLKAEQESLEKQAVLFDGKAGERLWKIFDRVDLAKRISVRKAQVTDLMLCYNWANDPATRQQSFSSNSILLTEHKNWFESKLLDPLSFYYILEYNSTPVAQIRFQVKDNESVLSYLVDSTNRNTGLGTIVLSKGIAAFINDIDKPVAISGFVKETNIASQKSFERLQFKKEMAAEYPGSFKYTIPQSKVKSVKSE